MGDLLMRVAGVRRACAALLVVLGPAVASAQPASRPLNERGPADAPVTVVEFCTYTSEPCSRLDVVLGSVLIEFGDRVRLVFHDVPADDTPAASLRSRAALAAGQQGKFWAMHGLLMANRLAITAADLPRMAHQLGIDEARFERDLDGVVTLAAVAEDRDESRVQSVSTTPMVFVNGQPTSAPLAATDLRAAIRSALAGR